MRLQLLTYIAKGPERALKITQKVIVLDLRNCCSEDSFLTAMVISVCYPSFHYFLLYRLECVNNFRDHNIPYKV